jgi:glycosyltransferase involved in cell wall biosynthesis
MTERRVLHLGNILNNGYLNAKFLRRRNWAADSVTVDYRHVQAQPEWEEVAIIDPKLDQFEPDWTSLDLDGYTRVGWFHDPKLAEISGLAAAIATARELGQDPAPVPGNTRPPWTAGIRPLLRSTLERVGLLTAGRAAVRNARVLGEKLDSEGVGQKLVAEFAAVYPDMKGLTLQDVIDIKERSVAHAPLFSLYPLVQAYSLDPIYVMINDPSQPFICFEHGTMREFPFEDSARGRLYSLALTKAERVFITNADCNRSAERLGLTNYTFVPHPVDEELYRPRTSPLTERLRRAHDVDYVFVAPARHHWKHCPPGLENSWFKRNDILIRGLGRFFHSHPAVKALVVFFEWGQEVELSKQLIAECGFSDRVRWEPIASKPVMVDYYNAADVVFDQFNDGIGTFGTVVPESLACGKPVLLNYKKELHRWCFNELPPALNAAAPEQIEEHVVRLLGDEAARLDLGRKGRDWFIRNHSSSFTAQRMIDVYCDISDRHGWNWREETH